MLKAFGLPAVPRKFKYAAMFSSTWQFVDHWGKGSSVPDLTQTESQMWFFYAGTSWIKQGIEGLHLGQIMLMSSADKGMVHTNSLFTKLRAFAAKNARRGFVLLNAHLYDQPNPAGGTFVHLGSTNQLIFDFHAFPSRPQPHALAPMHCTLNATFEDAIYTHSAAGVSVQGWTTTSLPYIVELDNYGCTNHPGVQLANDTFHPFGWDEISWFAHQPSSYRSYFLHYAAGWLAANDPKGMSSVSMIRNFCRAFSPDTDTSSTP